MQWIALLLFTVFLPVNMLAQTTSPKGAFTNTGGEITWQALANRVPGLDDRRLAHLEQEWQVAEIEPNLLKMTHTLTGTVKYVDITNHTVDFSKLAANPNVQVIDLINADTMLYNWKYKRRNMFPIGSLVGYPMVIGDFNNNGQLDLAGSYREPLLFHELADAAVAELQADSTFTIQKVYTDSTHTVLAYEDIDNDGFGELVFSRHNQHFTVYEQSHQDSFPNVELFRHRLWELSGEVSREIFTDMDQDGFREVLYKGDDSLPPAGHHIFVAEYKPASQIMERIFRYAPTPDWRTSRFSVGDFDRDGFPEFATGSITGQVYVVENTGDDSYQPTFQDTVSTPNAYLTVPANDIDGNGKTEFFLGGSAFYNGIPATRIYWFESDANNNYIKRRSFFLLGTDVLGFDIIFVHDINGDGVDDLVFSFSFSIVMLIWNNGTEQFELFYYDAWENYDQEIHSINMFDVFDSGEPDLFINIVDISSPPLIRTYFYKPNKIVGITKNKTVINDFNLEQNYPNPFNGITTIRFHLPTPNRISLTIYDITGKEVVTLINNQYYVPGVHSANWNGRTNKGKEVKSGTYLYELRAGNFKKVKKILFIK